MRGVNGVNMLILCEYFMLMALYGLSPARRAAKSIFAGYGVLLSICMLLARFGYISANLRWLDGVNCFASMIIVIMLMRIEYKRNKSA